MRCSIFFSLNLNACLFFAFNSFSVVSRFSCFPRHSCIPHHVTIDVFTFQNCTYASAHNTICCILSSYLPSSPIRSPSRRNVCNRSSADERGVKKIAASGRIWQGNRFEDFPVSPVDPPSVVPPPGEPNSRSDGPPSPPCSHRRR